MSQAFCFLETYSREEKIQQKARKKTRPNQKLTKFMLGETYHQRFNF